VHWGHVAEVPAQCRAALTLRPAEGPACPTPVAGIDDPIRGVARPFEARSARLELFCVDVGWMGRGIGAALFGWVTETAPGLGVTRLEIEADPGAVPSYERIGARKIGTVPSAAIAGRFLPRLALRF